MTFTSLIVKEYLEQWLEQTVKRQNRIRTYDRYAGDIHNYLIPELGKHQLAKLTPAHVQALLNKLADAITGHRWELLYHIALGLGLRKGESLGLRWEDVDFDMAILRITGSLQRQRGHLERTATKTEASIRAIALPPSLLAMLCEYKQRQADMRAVARRWTDTGLVFTSSVGTPIEPSDLSRHFKQVLKEAGLPEHTRFHDLRHSCATLLIVMGIHPRVVMEILGHSQISTTTNIYAHVLPRVQREAIAGLDALFGEAKPIEAAAQPANGQEASPAEAQATPADDQDAGQAKA